MVDPLTKKYPELTPYQFASNSPISGVDLDGLEYFYASSGQFIGKKGESKEVFVLQEKDIIDYVKSKSEANNGFFRTSVSDVINNVKSTATGLTNEDMLGRAHLTYGEAGSATFKATAHTIQNREDLLNTVSGMPSEYNFLDAMMADGNTDVKPEEYFSEDESINKNSRARIFAKARKNNKFDAEQTLAISAVLEASTRGATDLYNGKYSQKDPTKGAIEWRGVGKKDLKTYLEARKNETKDGVIKYQKILPIYAGSGRYSVYRDFTQEHLDKKYPGKDNIRWNKSRGLLDLKLLKK